MSYLLFHLYFGNIWRLICSVFLLTSLRWLSNHLLTSYYPVVWGIHWNRGLPEKVIQQLVTKLRSYLYHSSHYRSHSDYSNGNKLLHLFKYSIHDWPNTILKICIIFLLIIDLPWFIEFVLRVLRWQSNTWISACE